MNILYYVDLIYGESEVSCLFTNWEYQRFNSINHQIFNENTNILDYFEVSIKLPYYFDNEDSLLAKDFTEESVLEINGGFGDTHEQYSNCFDFSGVFYADYDYMWSYQAGRYLLFRNEFGAKLNRSRMRDLLHVLKHKYYLNCYQLSSDFIPKKFISDDGIADGAVTIDYLKFQESEKLYKSIENLVGSELEIPFKEYLRRYNSQIY